MAKITAERKRESSAPRKQEDVSQDLIQSLSVPAMPSHTPDKCVRVSWLLTTIGGAVVDGPQAFDEVSFVGAILLEFAHYGCIISCNEQTFNGVVLIMLLNLTHVFVKR